MIPPYGTKHTFLYYKLSYKLSKNNTMGFIIWVIGVVLCIKAVIEIMKWDVDGVKKLLVAIILLLTSWAGILVYYFWGRENLPALLK